MVVKNSIYFLLSTFFLVFFSCGGNETNNNENTDSSSALNITETEIEGYTLPEELTYTRSQHGFNYDKFYPIGWSKSGKLAFIIEPADEGSGFYLFEIRIIDIVNDKLVWSWKPEESEEGSLESTWKENYELFEENLKSSEIIQKKDFKLEQASTSYKGNDYEIIMETSTEVDPDYSVDMVSEITINLQSPELGSKQIFNQKVDSRDYILSAYVPGYLLSKYDDRIVVICQQERIAPGGPPNTVFFELIGSDLTRGFKKDDNS